ncbi:beta strand repeat-containing protein [Pseudoduganella violacea]|uniref:Putative repeat protein (TIGR01451 family) n=1 Tax=Pseudoduganella violacea TaxID=1715466 RepID=A0A7W5BEV4_9BURK|nr:DUF11 domain-containing protein [Pseudoduganella violacea]MBB3121698.1 putative repeat protein (TIGR01451 family) [Pseudoduganella violacea]
MAKAIKPSVNLDQWADGAAPDLPVLSGSQADQWQNGNLGSSQAHYSEGESVPYRAVFSGLKEGNTYWVTVQWDTTKSGVHALDYINTWNASFPGSRNETVPVPTQGVADPLNTLNLVSSAAIPHDPNAPASQQAGQFTLFGGATFLNYVLAGPDGKFGTNDDIDLPSSVNPYTLLGSYGGDSSTQITLKFVYNGNNDSTAGEIGSAVLAWGGHIATRADWGAGNSAAAIAGSPYHTSLTAFADNDPSTSESVGQQDRSLSSAAVTFPGTIVVAKETSPDGNTTQSFNFELTRPANAVDVIGGKLDISGDGVIDGKDDGRFTDAGGESFNVTDGNVSDVAGGDGLVGTYAIVGAGLDINASGTLTADDKFTNLAGVGVAVFSLKDGESRTFNNLPEFGPYTVKEVNIPTDWDLTSIGTSVTNINNVTTTGTIANPAGDQTTITLAEADSWKLTFNDAFVAAPSVSILKSVADVDGGGGAAHANAAGDVIRYAIVIGNTGNVPLTGVNVTDKVEGLGATNATYVSGDSNNNNQLDTNESWTYSASYTVQQSDLDGNGGGDGDIDNTATVTTAQTQLKDSSASVPLDLTRALAIDKQFINVTGGNNNAAADAVGDVIHYQMLVTNTGNTALDNVQVSDPLLTNETFFGGDTDNDGRLDVGETWAYTGSYTVTQADLDGLGNAGSDRDIDNTATATANNTPPAQDSVEVPLSVTRGLAIDKQFVNVTGGNNNTVADAVGDVIHYQMLVTNTGNTALDNVQVSDPLLTDETFFGGDTDNDGRLDVGETWAYTGSYTVTQADLDGQGNAGNDFDIDNTATATANNTPPVQDSVEVPLSVTRALAIDKQFVNVTDGNGNTVADAAGDIIHYQMLVTNTGTTALENVQVSDPLLTNETFFGGDTDNDGRLDVGETWAYTGSYTVTQADLDGNGGGDGDIDNTATATADSTPPAQDSVAVPLTYNPAMSITKTADRSTANLNDVINYTMLVANTGNVTLTGVTLNDPLLSNEAYASGDGNSNGKLDVGETWTYTGTYTVTQAVIDHNGVDANGNFDNDHDIDNTATADSDQTAPVSASAAVGLFDFGAVSIDVVKFVSVDGGQTWQDANLPTGPVLLAGTNPLFKFEVTGDPFVTLNNVILSDSDPTFDLNGTDPGTGLLIGTLAPGQKYTLVYDGATFHAGQHTDTASVEGTTVLGETVHDSDDANYFGFSPITVSGHPQFNFPNDLEKIQPKLQGNDAFIINPLGYISWDLFTSDNKLANIDTAANFLSRYTGLTVSIQEIWNSVAIGDKTTSGADAIYRIYVANESAASIALDNSHNIVEYDIVALSTNKGLVDLINSDPLIGNFNNFSNIENAIGKAGNGFTIGNTPVITPNADRIWSSTDVTGTGTNETPAPVVGIDGSAGNDAIYGRNNGPATTEVLSGGAGNDMIEARDGGDTVNGGAGNDYLFGSLSSDALNGGDGNDILFGGYGADSLTGGAGNDTFILRKGDFDTILDFDVTAGGGDQLKVWLQSLDNVAATGTHTTSYDIGSGIVFVDSAPVVQLVGSYTEAQVLSHLILT